MISTWDSRSTVIVAISAEGSRCTQKSGLGVAQSLPSLWKFGPIAVDVAKYLLCRTPSTESATAVYPAVGESVGLRRGLWTRLP